MSKITLFCGTKNQTTYDLHTDLTIANIDEFEDDLLVDVDLCGITLEYISTSNGLDLESAYFVDGGYCFLPIHEFKNEILSNYVKELVLEYFK